MSIDTQEARKYFCVGGVVQQMCDEIDRLRDREDELMGEANDLRVSEADALNTAESMRTELARLRDDVKTLRSENEDLRNANGGLATKYVGCREKLSDELANLREQIRPRSIKEEPPPNGLILVWDRGMWTIFDYARHIGVVDFPEITHWLPMPPAHRGG